MRLKKWLEVQSQFFGIGEGKLGCVFFQKKVERVYDCHVGDNVDGNRKQIGWLMKDQTRQEVAVRILLPVDKVIGRFDFQ